MKTTAANHRNGVSPDLDDGDSRVPSESADPRHPDNGPEDEGREDEEALEPFPWAEWKERLTPRSALLVPRSRRNRLICVAALAVLLMLAVAQILTLRTDGFPSDAIVRANGHVINLADFNQQVKVLGAIYDLQKPTDPSKLPAFNQAMAKALAVEQVIDDQAKEHKISISDKAADDQLTDLIQQDFSAGGQSAFTAKLNSLGITQADVIAQLKDQMATSQLYSQITAKVPLATVAQAQAYYNTHRAQVVSSETRHLANIVVSSQAQAQQLLQQLQGGASFATLAQQDSLDGSTKDKGGDIGTVSPSQLESSYSTAAFAAPQGGFYGPVQTEYGWNIGQVLGITPSQPLTFSQAEQQIRTNLQSEQQDQVWNAWIVARIKAANVRYRAGYRPAQPDAAPSGQPG